MMRTRSTYRQRVWVLAVMLCLGVMAFYQRAVRPLTIMTREADLIESQLEQRAGDDNGELQQRLTELEKLVGGSEGRNEDEAQRALLNHLGELCRANGAALVAALPGHRSDRSGVRVLTSEIVLSGSLRNLLRTIHAWEGTTHPPAKLVSLDLHTQPAGLRRQPVLHANLIFRSVSRVP